MNRLLKKLTPVAIFLLVVVFGVGQARADFTATNDQTGYESENTVEAQADGSYVVVSTNGEVVENAAEVESETGDNEESGNNGLASILSGDAMIVGGFANLLNMNLFSDDSSPLDNFTASNDTTGAYSENKAEAEAETYRSIFSSNGLLAMNGAEAEAETGDNEAGCNNGTADIETGDAGIGAIIANAANGNELDLGDGVGTIAFSALASNENTGAYSENEAEAESESYLEYATMNMASLFNMMDLEAETGDNEACCNGGTADIDTGNAEGVAEIGNMVNMTESTINMDAGAAEIMATNESTGCDSENEAEAEVKTFFSLVNFNDLMLNNEIEMELDTGDNEACCNGGTAEINTGDAEADIDISNTDSNVNTNDISVDLGDITVSAGNATTGSHSENEAEAELEVGIGLVNTNIGMINNEVEVEANTGGNEAKGNGGPVTVTSGDTSTDVAVENQMNMNVNNITYSPAADITATNENTGCGSENEASAEVNTNIEVVNTNLGVIGNNIEVESNTGGNEAKYNGGGTITSGDSAVTFGVVNATNGNSTTISQ